MSLSVIPENKQTNWETNMEFYKHDQYCFCSYVIKSTGETANKVLLSVIWITLLIEINLSQIRTLDIKREEVCAVYPLTFIFQGRDIKTTVKIRYGLFVTFSHTYQLLLYILAAPT